MSTESNCQCVRSTSSKRLTPGYFATYPSILPFTIHWDTMQNSNNTGATPSICKTFGCFARLKTITSLQYFWTKNRQSAPKCPAADGQVLYLVNLFDRILLVHAKRLDCEHQIWIFLIGELPNIRESSRCKRPVAGFAEREGDYVGTWKDPI